MTKVQAAYEAWAVDKTPANADALFEQLQWVVRSVVRTPPGEREDMVQACLMSIWRRLPQYDSRLSQITTFAYRVCRGEMLDEFRNRSRPKRRGTTVPIEGWDGAYLDKEVMDSGFWSRVRGAVTEKRFQAISAVFAMGMSQTEASEHLGCSKQNVFERIALSRPALQEALAGFV